MESANMSTMEYLLARQLNRYETIAKYFMKHDIIKAF